MTDGTSQGEENNVGENPLQPTTGIDSLSDEEKKRRIKQIDTEMKVKLLEIQKFMASKGLGESAKVASQILEQGKDQPKLNNNVNRNANIESVDQSRSEETIYRDAVKISKNFGRLSSSADDADSSSEFVDMNYMICSITGKGNKNKTGPQDDKLMDFEDPENPQPSTSQRPKLRQLSADDRSEDVVRSAEKLKGVIFTTPGKEFSNKFHVDMARDMIHSVLVDEEYTAIGSHLDENIVNKIKRGEYVDFAKLLPRDRLAIEEDNRIQPIFKDGQVFWQTPNDWTNSSINNFHKWEQAFRVYSKIYTQHHPHRATELIQYSHDIHAASLTFIWENVYQYDKEFRLHLSRHPMRSWAVILQHAWNLKMKDRIGHGQHHDHREHKVGNNLNFPEKGNKSKQAEACRRYNRGHCNFGANCRYEHKCSYCSKFGHGILGCRKLGADRDNKANRKEQFRHQPDGKEMDPPKENN